MKATLWAMVLAALAFVTVNPVRAADSYPSQQIRLVVQVTPGAAYTLIQMLSDRLSQRFGEKVEIVNRQGAAGRIALTDVAQAKPDGYTIGDALIGNLAAAPALYPDTAYDPLKSFAAITTTTFAPYVLAVPASSSMKTYKDLVDFAKAHPDELAYGSPGTGSTGHIATELLLHAANLKIRHIPYNGVNQSIIDLGAGRVQVVFTNLSTLNSFIQSGQVRALAVTGHERSPVQPNVPTFYESGLDFDFQSWHGIVTTAGTPPDIVSKLNAAIKDVLQDPEVQKVVASDGGVVKTSTPEEFQAYIKSEYERVKQVIHDADIRAE